MAYNGFLPENVISIGKIYSIHYFEYMSDFSFEGESHDFWEFICVDKGEVEVTGGDKKFILHKGEIAFHEPNEFHNVTATGTIAPNLIVISFQCDDNAIYYFRKKILKMDDVERNLLASIIFEARHTFQCRLDDPYLQNMPLKQPPDIFGSQQMIRLLIEQFLIHLARRYSASYTSVVRPKDTLPAAKSTKSKNDIEIYSLVTEYMKEHIRSHVTIEQICKDNLVGRSRLQKIFKNQCGLGIIDYFSKLKINTAKELIRSKHMNFTQISDYLGYTSIHYFSRQFKKETGMTPTEYASSIKAMSEGKFEEN